MKTVKAKALTVGGIYAFDAVAILVLVLLGWI